MSECTRDLQKTGVAYPRTCAECGLGPCKRYALQEPSIAQRPPAPLVSPDAEVEGKETIEQLLERLEEDEALAGDPDYYAVKRLCTAYRALSAMLQPVGEDEAQEAIRLICQIRFANGMAIAADNACTDVLIRAYRALRSQLAGVKERLYVSKFGYQARGREIKSLKKVIGQQDSQLTKEGIELEQAREAVGLFRAQVTARIAQNQAYVQMEKLSGNVVKLASDKAALAECYGLLAAFEEDFKALPTSNPETKV